MNAIATGRSAELTDNPVFKYFDRNTWLDRIPLAAEELYAAMTPESRDYFDAFATGFNMYAEEFPEDFEENPFATVRALSLAPICFHSNRLCHCFVS